ncbi:MAG: hypothetical protein JJU29_16110 [Verrucomicrobia bacterium]|nr:hypothetical protein [Verrucomicrobiota bacterium]MCH8510238.1 hypothetical protein [Kiritimatiellia bacterium]
MAVSEGGGQQGQGQQTDENELGPHQKRFKFERNPSDENQVGAQGREQYAQKNDPNACLRDLLRTNRRQAQQTVRMSRTLTAGEHQAQADQPWKIKKLQDVPPRVIGMPIQTIKSLIQ